jgi:plasmid stabilization system protein ParE
MEIRHLKQAVADAQREALFWQDKESELRDEFAKELAASIEIISRSPNAFLLVSQKRKLRRFYEKRFHTQILYEYLPEKDLLQIVRVYNARMNPKRFLPSESASV